MERAAVELERRSRYLSSLIQQQGRRRSSGDGRAAAREAEKVVAEEGEVVVVVMKEQREAEAAREAVAGEPAKGEKPRKGEGDAGRGGGGADPGQQRHQGNVRVRAADMPPELQKRAFRCAQQMLAAMPKLDGKRLALTLKKEFDSSYGPAWHCIVGKSFGSYVTHSLGGFLYFSIDKVYILLFRTAVERLEQ